MSDISECFALDIAEDVRKTKRTRVSLSSTDSEPIPKRSKRSLDASSYSSGEENDSAVGAGSDVFPAARHCASLGVDPEAAPEPADDLPPSTIPLERVSQASACTITAVLSRDRTLVADNASGSIVMDVGTRLCLGDGTAVGAITAVLGPVSSCAYAVAGHPSTFAALRESGRLVAGAALRCDLGAQRLIFDPAAQCDAGRGTDASYINDEELPPHVRPDFSDDEAERRWKAERGPAAGHAGAEAQAEASSGEELVEVDWGKLSALDGFYKEADAQEQEADGNGCQERKANSCSMRLIVPPWLSWNKE